jgi:Tfp pilus assembly protein PilV
MHLLTNIPGKSSAQSSHALFWTRRGPRQGRAGFTLLEVIFAFAIFFMVSFSILELTSNSLASARALQKREPDGGLIAAMLSLTNQLVEGVESGDFQEIYPDLYPGWHWASEIIEIGSNGLFQADIIVHRDVRKGPAMTRMSVLYYRPESPPGSASGGFGF